MAKAKQKTQKPNPLGEVGKPRPDGLVPQPHGGALKPTKPGERRMTGGRKSAGLAIIEWINALQGKTHAEYKAIARDPEAPGNKRVAAIQWLKSLSDATDIGDYSELMEGSKTLSQYVQEGRDLRKIKRVKRRVDKDGNVSNEIDLDTSGGMTLDRILDRTVGKPVQTMEISTDGSLRPVILAPQGVSISEWSTKAKQVDSTSTPMIDQDD